jgi:hypothetical protein
MIVAGRDIHHDTLGYALLLTDIPVMLLASVLSTLVPSTVGPMGESYLLAAYWFLVGGAWWFGVGWAIVRVLSPGKRVSPPYEAGGL